jgi:hypothetical protein
LPGLEPPIIQPVAQGYTTELSRFLLPYGRPEMRWGKIEMNHKLNCKNFWIFSNFLGFGEGVGS